MKRFLFLLALVFVFVTVPAYAQTNVQWEVIKEPEFPGVYTNLIILGDKFPVSSMDTLRTAAKAIRDSLVVYAEVEGWVKEFKQMRIVVGLTSGDFFGSYVGADGGLKLQNEGFQKMAATANTVPKNFDPEKDMLLLLVKGRGLGSFWDFGLSYQLAIVSFESKFFIHIVRHEAISHGYGFTADEYAGAVSLYETYFREEWPNIMRVDDVGILRREQIKWFDLFSLRNIVIPTPREGNKGRVAFFSIHPTKNSPFYIPRTFCLMNGGSDWSIELCPVCRRAVKNGLARRLATLAADFDRDGEVDFEDFFLFSDGFGKKKGQNSFNAIYDLNGDGEIGFEDFFIFADSFGKRAGARKPIPATKPVAIGQVRQRCYHVESEVGFGHNHEIIPVGTMPELSQNFPNPFNPETMISYHLPERTRVNLTVYNLLGQRILTLVDETRGAGDYKIRWGGKDKFGRKLASGVYFYVLETEKFSEKRNMTIIK